MTAYRLESKWCVNHGAEFCEALVTGQKPAGRIGRAAQVPQRVPVVEGDRVHQDGGRESGAGPCVQLALAGTLAATVDDLWDILAGSPFGGAAFAGAI